MRGRRNSLTRSKALCDHAQNLLSDSVTMLGIVSRNETCHAATECIPEHPCTPNDKGPEKYEKAATNACQTYRQEWIFKSCSVSTLHADPLKLERRRELHFMNST